MGEVLAVRDAYRAQEWAMLIQECSASGLTKWEFAAAAGVEGTIQSKKRTALSGNRLLPASIQRSPISFCRGPLHIRPAGHLLQAGEGRGWL